MLVTNKTLFNQSVMAPYPLMNNYYKSSGRLLLSVDRVIAFHHLLHALESNLRFKRP